MTEGTLPPKLAEILETLATAPKVMKTEILLQFARKMPLVPEEEKETLERVDECTTPFFVKATVVEGVVHLLFDAPKESPTVRAFAGLLAAGLEGEKPEAVFAVPDDFYYIAKLEDIVTPLRLRGLHSVLLRIKRQVREALERNLDSYADLP